MSCHLLTPRNYEVAHFIRFFLNENDQVPAMADIAKHFGWKSNNAAQEHISKLMTAGVIEKNGCWYRFKRGTSNADV